MYCEAEACAGTYTTSVYHATGNQEKGIKLVRCKRPSTRSMQHKKK